MHRTADRLQPAKVIGMKSAKLLVFLLVLTGFAWLSTTRDAIAKCPIETYVVTGGLDLPEGIKRVGVSVFLDEQQTSRLVQFELPVSRFEVSVVFATLVQSRFVILGDDCSRKPRQLELLVTDGKRVTFRKQFSEKDFAITDGSTPRRINLGNIRFRAPS